MLKKIMRFMKIGPVNTSKHEQPVTSQSSYRIYALFSCNCFSGVSLY